MKAFVSLAALAALSACSQQPEQDHAALTAAESVGTYDYTLADGSDGTAVLAADGTFTDAMAGETITGSWGVADGKLCLDPAGEDANEQRRCYSLGEPDTNGAQTATSDTGEPIKVVKRNE
jgi:hypothetical protein